MNNDKSAQRPKDNIAPAADVSAPGPYMESDPYKRIFGISSTVDVSAPSGLTLDQQHQLCKALEDLSFECFGVFDVVTPSRATYNRTFEVLDRLRKALAAQTGESLPVQGVPEGWQLVPKDEWARHQRRVEE